MSRKLVLALLMSATAASNAHAALTTPPGGGVVGSVHDMNVMVGAGIVRDTGEGRVCVYCHTPHHAMDSTSPELGDYLPLWSRQLTKLSYAQYGEGADSAARQQAADPLTGPSRLCMSCHDGSIALDQHNGIALNRNFTTSTSAGFALQAGNDVNAALNRTHPIGFKLADAATLHSAPADTSVMANLAPSNDFKAGVFDGTAFYLRNPRGKTIGSQLFDGYMTCATCHDVHNRDNATNKAGIGLDDDHLDSEGRNYLVFSPQSGSQLCLSCHNK